MVVGLGNPGPKFMRTRHNVGFLVVEHLAELLGVRLRKPLFRPYEIASVRYEDEEIFLIRPLTFMNNSGVVLPGLLRRTRCSVKDLIVLCDNLDLPPGQCRLKRNGSTAGHNGLKSLVAELDTGDFRRLYLGIGRPSDGDVIRHVLEVPSNGEWELTSEAVRIAGDAVMKCFTHPTEQVMNELNRRRVG